MELTITKEYDFRGSMISHWWTTSVLPFASVSKLVFFTNYSDENVHHLNFYFRANRPILHGNWF